MAYGLNASSCNPLNNFSSIHEVGKKSSFLDLLDFVCVQDFVCVCVGVCMCVCVNLS